MAELICAAVAPVPALVSVLQAVVAHCAHALSGRPPGIPAFDQLIARDDERIPDHCCADASEQGIANTITTNKTLTADMG
jgi:hypothetical protein